MSIASTIASLINLADPERNSNHNERRAAWEKARKLMDEHGVSFQAAGIDYATAERVGSQSFEAPVSWLARIFGGGRKYSDPPKREDYKSDWGTRGHYKEKSESQDVYHSYNDPASPDYQFQINYDESNNGYWDGVG
jgi:hypothetical protein